MRAFGVAQDAAHGVERLETGEPVRVRESAWLSHPRFMPRFPGPWQVPNALGTKNLPAAPRHLLPTQLGEDPKNH